MKMSGICRGSEGVLDETTAPCIVFELIMYHTTVLVRGVCVCAVHLTVNLRSSYDRGKRKILRVHHLMPTRNDIVCTTKMATQCNIEAPKCNIIVIRTYLQL